MAKWTKIDLSTLDGPPGHLTPEDQCWFLREYLVESTPTKEHAWELGETNQLVSNLKKGVKYRGTGAWRYKLKAIEVFAQELAERFKKPRLVAAIPSSKTTDDPEYDDRLDLVLARAKALNPLIRICKPVRRTRTIEASHTRSGQRRPEDQLDSLEFAGLPDVFPDNAIMLVDDVLTSGSTFKACQRVIQTARPDVIVGGCFWARRKTVITDFPEVDLTEFLKRFDRKDK